MRELWIHFSFIYFTLSCKWLTDVALSKCWGPAVGKAVFGAYTAQPWPSA